MAKHNQIGQLGEQIAAEFLEGKGLPVIDRNVRRKYGEFDIISRETSGKVRFIEVKSVSYETGDRKGDISHETIYRPEDNMHPMKAKRLMRMIEAYLGSHAVGDWQFDVLMVTLNEKEKTAKVKHLENIILGS